MLCNLHGFIVTGFSSLQVFADRIGVEDSSNLVQASPLKPNEFTPLHDDEALKKQEVETAVTAAVEQEAERFRSEAKHLRAAAHKDLRQCREEGRVALAQAAAKWASEANALREAAAAKSRRHAARIREVIASEERCDQERLALETRLRAMAVQTLGLAISGARSARANEVAFIHDRVLTSELERAEAEAEHSEEARRALGDYRSR